MTKLAGADPANAQVSLRSDGITDVEQHGVATTWFAARVGLPAELEAWLRLTASHQSNHFLTFADAGKDNGRQDVGDFPTYNRGIIDPDTDEENPVFNEHLDLAGSRMRLASHLAVGVGFGIGRRF